jgi:hypothetical protein
MIPKLFVNCNNFNDNCPKMKNIKTTLSELLDLLRCKDEQSWDEDLYALKRKDYYKALEKYCADCDNFSISTEII